MAMALRRTKKDADSPKVAAKREAAKKKEARFTGFNATQEEYIKMMVREIAYNHIIEQADKRAQQKIDELMMRIPEAKTETFKEDRRFIKFTNEQLLALFGGWFTLRYAFTTKEMVMVKGKVTEVETDYWMCYKDVATIPLHERQMRNEPVFKRFGIEAYGYVLIAPASAFNGDDDN